MSNTQTLMWPRMALLPGLGGDLYHNWHVAINHHSGREEDGRVPFERMCFMYDAKTAAGEIPRLALLFCMEREGKLPAAHRQCSHSPSEPVKDNHLTCCLGVECRKCPHLLALEKMKHTPAKEAETSDLDWAKAWTCATHIISKGGDIAGEGYVLTVDDRMYWDRLHESLAQSFPSKESEP